MVFKRRTQRKKGASKWRPFRNYRRRTYKKKSVQKIHYFKRTKVDSIQVLDTTAFNAIYSNVATSVYNTFALNQLPNYTEWTSLYDQYKICGIRQKFVFDKNSSEMGAVGVPNLISVNDWNDTNALTDEAEALQYASYKSKRLDKPISRYFKPTMAVGQEIKKSQWIRTSNTSETHYGIKVAHTQIAGEQTPIGYLKVFTTFYVACRTPK